MLAPQREAFDLPEEVSYLDCAYMAPQLRTVTEVGHEALMRKRRPWTITPADFWLGVEQVRERVGVLVNGDVDGVAIVPSVAYAISTAAANLRVDPGGEIVVLTASGSPGSAATGAIGNPWSTAGCPGRVARTTPGWLTTVRTTGLAPGDSTSARQRTSSSFPWCWLPLTRSSPGVWNA